MISYDITGTPFVFSAWVSRMDGSGVWGRLIDHVPDDEGPGFAIEMGEVLLAGVGENIRIGDVILSDRVMGGTYLGNEIFYLDGCSRSIGNALDEEGVFTLVRSWMPKEGMLWPDLRAAAYPPPENEEEMISFTV
jgi:hypothetical protein